MDAIGFRTFSGELLADCREAKEAFSAAENRRSTPGPAGLEASAFQLVRLYNILEQAGLRVAKAFENHIDDDKGWHAELARRLSIEIEGVRPALWPKSMAGPLNQLRGFRHVVNHAYDLSIDPERLALVFKDAEEVVRGFRPACEAFLKAVAKQEGF